MEASLGGLPAAPGEEESVAYATEAQRLRITRIRFIISAQANDFCLSLEAQTSIRRAAAWSLALSYQKICAAAPATLSRNKPSPTTRFFLSVK